MKKIAIYVDTSVIGGCFDPEFKEWSLAILKDFQMGTYKILISELTEAEISDAPGDVQTIYLEFRKYAGKILELEKEAIDLAEAYLKHRILSLNFRNDARHIALATVAGADLLISWNFKHIVHYEKIQRFNAVNIELGYKPVSIYSPREVTRYGLKSS
jgi:hypothetical protein